MLGLGLVLGLGLGLVSGSSFVGVCRHLAAVVSIVDLWRIHDGRVRNINQYHYLCFLVETKLCLLEF